MKTVKVGNVLLGGDENIKIQSMTNISAKNLSACINQINDLEKAGCDIVRIAIPDEENAKAVSKIKENTSVPIVADIHFDYRLALMCMERGIDKVRINPGNIGSEENIKKVALMAKEKNIPIRIGINGGSLEKHLLEKYKSPCAEAMIESAKGQIEILKKYNFEDVVLSLKSSDVKKTIEAYRLASKTFDCPLHLGVTEAGTYTQGLVKSAIGIGSLLADGIGDTIRVSLTDDPIKEVYAAKEILNALRLGKPFVEVVSCPTCARCRINLIEIAKRVNERVKDIPCSLKVAVMGCAVNGPGEAKDADIGIAGGDKCAILFKKGEIVGKYKENEIEDVLIDEIKKITNYERN